MPLAPTHLPPITTTSTTPSLPQFLLIRRIHLSPCRSYIEDRQNIVRVDPCRLRSSCSSTNEVSLAWHSYLPDIALQGLLPWRSISTCLLCAAYESCPLISSTMHDLARRLTALPPLRWTQRTRPVRQDHGSCLEAVLWTRPRPCRRCRHHTEGHLGGVPRRHHCRARQSGK